MSHFVDNIEICINEVPKVNRCCICQEQTSAQSTIEKIYLRSSGILLKDVLFKCIQTEENLWKSITSENADNYICEFCVVLLSEFYDAFLKTSLKRTELISRIRERNESPFEYFVAFKSLKTDTNSDQDFVEQQSSERSEICHPIENYININLSDGYSTRNVSDDEFIEVHQPYETFEDDWSSDCSNRLQDDGNDEQRALITIERLPKSRLRFCWRCDKNYSSDADFETHLKQVHMKNKRDHSSKKYKKIISGKHCREANSDMPLSLLRCKACNEEFSSATLFHSHKNLHKEITCSICSKILPTQRSFQRHLANHRADKSRRSPDVRSFVCAVCDFKFGTAWNLKRHQKFYCLGHLKFPKKVF